MTWGDVLTAAIGACVAAGIDKPVKASELARLVREINAAAPIKED